MPQRIGHHVLAGIRRVSRMASAKVEEILVERMPCRWWRRPFDSYRRLSVCAQGDKNGRREACRPLECPGRLLKPAKQICAVIPACLDRTAVGHALGTAGSHAWKLMLRASLFRDRKRNDLVGPIAGLADAVGAVAVYHVKSCGRRLGMGMGHCLSGAIHHTPRGPCSI